MMACIKIENECCCCFGKEELFNMSEPYIFEEKFEIYSTMIAECFQIQLLNASVEDCKKRMYLICKNCVLRLRDAVMFRSQVQFVHAHSEVKSCKSDEHVPDVVETKENILNNDISEHDHTEYNRKLMSTKWNVTTKTECVKLEGECCCCFSKEDLFSMSEPYNFEEKVEIYSTMIAECFRIKLNSNVQDYKRNLQLICKNCVFRLRDAITFRLLVEIAYDRLQGKAACRNVYNVPMECSRVADTKDELICDEPNEDASKSKYLRVVVEKLDDGKMANITIVPKGERLRKLNTEGQKIQCSDMFLCNICNRLFTSLFVVRKHVKIHENKCYFCDHCGRSCTSRISMVNHMKTHANVKDFMCNICGVAYALKTSFLAHIAKHSNVKNHKCDVCEKTFNKKYHLNRHMETHNLVDIPCMYCNKIFHTKTSLFQHVKRHTRMADETDAESRKKFVCDICKKFFTREQSLGDHMLLHMGVKDVKCDMCDRYFVSLTALERHVRANHESIQTEKCTHCDKSFGNKSKLHIHMKTHSKKVEFVCNVCGKALRSKQSFKDHASLHSGVKNQKCDICGKAFVSRITLIRHKVIHFNPEKWTCKFCGKMFISNHALSTHQKIHLNIKDFACECCKKEFRSKAGLKRHMLTHSRRNLTTFPSTLSA